jgi:hypothetical protein
MFGFFVENGAKHKTKASLAGINTLHYKCNRLHVVIAIRMLVRGLSKAKI